MAGFVPAVLDVSAQQAKRVIKFGVNRGAENLDPVTQDANPDIWAFMQIYQQLVRVNVKGDGFEPDLAEKWTTSADGRTWTFMLRKNAKFSTGDPVTAADVVWSLKRARDTKGPWKWALEAVEDIAFGTANGPPRFGPFERVMSAASTSVRAEGPPEPMMMPVRSFEMSLSSRPASAMACSIATWFQPVPPPWKRMARRSTTSSAFSVGSPCT